MLINVSFLTLTVFMLFSTNISISVHNNVNINVNIKLSSLHSIFLEFILTAEYHF